MFQLFDTKQIFLSSSSNNENVVKRNSTFNSKINFVLPRLIHKNKSILYSTIRLIHAEIPYSFYTINDTNNKLYYKNMNTNISSTITIPKGNYNANTLASKLTTLFLPLVVTFNFDNSTGLYSFSCSIQIQFLFGLNSINNIIGLGNTNYITNLNNGVYTLTFPYQLNLLGSRNIYIKANNLVLENLNTNSGERCCLKSIPINVSPFGLIMYHNSSSAEFIVKNPQVDNLEIEFVDDNNNLINFENQDWSLTIEIKNVINLNQNFFNSINEYLEQL